MTTLNRLLPNILSKDLQSSRDFYVNLFDFNVDFDSDWFVHLISKDKQLELGIMDVKSDLTPLSHQNQPTGIVMTFVVDDVESIFERAKNMGLEIIKSPENTSYGQRRMLLQDPNGMLVDVSSPIPNFSF